MHLGDDPLYQSQSNLITPSLSLASYNLGVVSSHQKKRGLYQGKTSENKKLWMYTLHLSWNSNIRVEYFPGKLMAFHGWLSGQRDWVILAPGVNIRTWPRLPVWLELGHNCNRGESTLSQSQDQVKLIEWSWHLVWTLEYDPDSQFITVEKAHGCRTKIK